MSVTMTAVPLRIPVPTTLVASTPHPSTFADVVRKPSAPLHPGRAGAGSGRTWTRVGMEHSPHRPPSGVRTMEHAPMTEPFTPEPLLDAMAEAVLYAEVPDPPRVMTEAAVREYPRIVAAAYLAYPAVMEALMARDALARALSLDADRLAADRDPGTHR